MFFYRSLSVTDTQHQGVLPMKPEESKPQPSTEPETATPTELTDEQVAAISAGVATLPLAEATDAKWVIAERPVVTTTALPNRF
jgi:hypothetical protein